MISVRAAAVATQIIGALWALLAALYTPNRHDFATGIGVTLTGIAIWITASWWESR